MCVYSTGIVRNELMCGYANVVHTSSSFHTHTHTYTHTHSHTIWGQRTDRAKRGHCRMLHNVLAYVQADSCRPKISSGSQGKHYFCVDNSNEKSRVPVQCCFTPTTETVRTIRDGDPWTATSTFTQLLNSVNSSSVLLYVHRDHIFYMSSLWTIQETSGDAVSWHLSPVGLYREDM